jgi:hypothetical protein
MHGDRESGRRKAASMSCSLQTDKLHSVSSSAGEEKEAELRSGVHEVEGRVI